jgi:hypothetical protein
LTSQPYEIWNLLGRPIKVETAVEIVAKKLWHRGDMATARDLFDLALVIQKSPGALQGAAPFLIRHRDVFLAQLQQRQGLLKAQFEAIDTMAFNPSFEEAYFIAEQFLRQL